MKKIYLLLMTAMLAGTGALAQNDELRLSGLQVMVLPPTPVRPNFKATTKNPADNSATVMVYFTCSDPAAFTNLTFLLGEEKDKHSIKKEKLKLSQQKDYYYLYKSKNVEAARFHGSKARYQFTLTPAEMNKLKYITVYGTGKGKKTSNKEYLKIK